MTPQGVVVVRKRDARTPGRTEAMTKLVVARLPLTLIDEAQELAELTGSSVSALVEAALTDLIKKAKKGLVKAS